MLGDKYLIKESKNKQTNKKTKKQKPVGPFTELWPAFAYIILFLPHMVTMAI